MPFFGKKGKQCPLGKWHGNKSNQIKYYCSSAPKGTILRTIKRCPNQGHHFGATYFFECIHWCFFKTAPTGYLFPIQEYISLRFHFKIYIIYTFWWAPGFFQIFLHFVFFFQLLIVPMSKKSIFFVKICHVEIYKVSLTQII